ncbi:hypothetical protein CVT25_008780 [Psilocybe cyanescens]|uniref:Uncharacterized protein n=1 Tax=Psilocybe cyanescens TaxID=93625 RepID=A0A409XMW9_PSICY|nr:hypothetical protein CVT25_008780 [Psilocybe cyanescens]
MSFHDEAHEGTLRRQDQFPRDLSGINDIGGKLQLTPLCGACVGGHLHTVKLLLANNANPDASSDGFTPLFYLTDFQCTAPSTVRCAIIRELLAGKSGTKADLDSPCDDEQNTPLMNAIVQLKDEAVIKQLVECGASTTHKHPVTQKSAQDLAEEHDMSHCLRLKADFEMMWGKLVDLVVSFVLLVVAYANNKTMTNLVDGVVKRYYNISVKEADVSKDRQKEVEPKSIEQFQSLLNDEVKKDKKFERFFAPDDPFLSKLASKANALISDDTTDLGKPENIKHLTRLSLYEPYIYCDDSGSMRYENRYDYQVELVKRIARIATKIVPDDMVGVKLRFINNPFASEVSAQDIENEMKNIKPSGQTNIGTNLRKKILEPFVYQKIAKPLVAGEEFPFRRPILVCIITDGTPEPEGRNTLRDVIIECKKKLEEKKYDPTAVMFVISQIGTSQQAADFIDGLRKEDDIRDVIYCTVGQLDAQFKELKDNERGLESRLLHILTKPIMERHAE